MAGDERGVRDEVPGHHARRRLVTIAVAAAVAVVVTVPLVRWWRERPVDVDAIVEVDGRACFGRDPQLWITDGTVRPPGQADLGLPATFRQTATDEGVLTASGTSVLARTSPTTHDPRLAVGCAIP
ncbi:MAG: hypothetical protein U0Q07_05400 [Acidimicrobiales bacterium]